jgi:5'-3' exonuclease
MIIVDFSQVMFSNLMANIRPYSHNEVFDENMLRHMILNSLQSYRQKFVHEYGELVIACDSHNYWRKSFFPHYKANRKKLLDNFNLDWDVIFKSFNKIKGELKENFPYKVLEIETAEADDIVGTLVQAIDEQALILSGDHDFIQLQIQNNVKQYDPIRKKWITDDNPNKYLLEHIMKGDAGDGIPSILCEDDYYVNEDRQIKRLTQKKINDLMNKNKEEWPTELQRNFDRNSSLISLLDKRIPLEIRNKIIDEYSYYHENGRNKLMPYFIKYKLKNLLDVIGNF